jgi:hypothetical protein
MAIQDADISHKLVHVIQPSEKLSSRIKDGAAEIGPEAMSLEIRTAMTRLRPPSPSVKAVLAEFVDTACVVRWDSSATSHNLIVSSYFLVSLQAITSLLAILT